MLEQFDAFLVLEIAKSHPKLAVVAWKALLTAPTSAIETEATRLRLIWLYLDWLVSVEVGGEGFIRNIDADK